MKAKQKVVLVIHARKYITSGILISTLFLRGMSIPVVAVANETKSVISSEANIKSIEEYLGLVQTRIKGNWHPPKGNQTIRATAEFKILPSGQIVNIKIIQTAKNPAVEAAAFEAVEQSTPFPRLTSPPYNKEGLDCQMVLDFKVRGNSQVEREIVKATSEAEKYSYKGDWGSAIGVLRSALAKNPNNIELKERLSDLYSNQAQGLVYKDPKRALELANEAIALDPQNLKPYNRLVEEINKSKEATTENIATTTAVSSPTTGAQATTEHKPEVVEPKAVSGEDKAESTESKPEVAPQNPANNANVEANDESKAEGKRLFLWKATRANQTVYLLGTIHVVRPDFYPIPDEIEKAFAQSKELFVECIPDRIKIQNSANLVNAKHAYTNGDKLSNHLSPETKKVFEEYLTWAGEPLEIYESYRPSQVSGLISSDATRRYGLKAPGLDMYLIGKSKPMNKKVTELESVDFQVNLLSSFSEAEQDAQLLSALLDLKDIPNNLDGTMAAWRQGDPDRLEEITRSDQQLRPALKAVNDKIINARNQSMVNKLEDCLKSRDGGTYFVAVGAAHLVGDYGLPALLTKRGFSVAQVSVPKVIPQTSFGSHKLQRLYYPEGRFSILLPGPADPAEYGDTHGMRSVLYKYETFAGIYIFGYVITPQAISDPAKIDAFYNIMGMSMIRSMSASISKSVTGKAGTKDMSKKVLASKTAGSDAAASKSRGGKSQSVSAPSSINMGSISQIALNICNHPGREIRAEINEKGELGLIRFRMVMIDRYFYILIVGGKKAWADAPIINDFLNSLNVREDPHSKGVNSGRANNTSSGAGSTLNQREFDRRMQETQLRIRNQSEQMKAKSKYRTITY